MIETEDGVSYKRDRNFIKPRQVPNSTSRQNEYFTAPGCSGEPPSVPEASISGPATSQAASPDAILGLTYSLAKKFNSTQGRIGARMMTHPRCISNRSYKGITPNRLI